ncbi:MAG TPA: Stk1 family PASTA domain-containing Ser/Thr kinase [Bacillota bacterium]|nr:Stk1 family PASTA domain-containing Ser/Thr kinase [Bacillota bacterium]
MLKGQLLNERYKIIKRIGGGGMANVYLARDIILDRDVAVKALRMEYANDQEFIARFDREAQSATSLAHPNIVNIYDIGEEDHMLYMVMEYVDGMTLKEYIQQYGPLSVPETLDIMKQITSAINHAHANNIIHRDIKPQNILINTYGQVKVTDFGIAIALSATTLTQTNSILGSVHYLSPEQARGGMATKKSDVYSLGIVLFELLTGRLPFSGHSPVSIALKHLQSETPSVRDVNPDIPQSVENIVLKATTKDPFHRYETVDEMENALDRALDPAYINEEKYVAPSEVGEDTKAIPIITDDPFYRDRDEDTIIHPADGAMQASQPIGKKKAKSKKKRKWPIFVTILLALLAAGIAAMFIIPGILQPKDVEIPDVVEMAVNDALDKLEEHQLIGEKKTMHSDDIEEGLVIKTNPETGQTVKEGTTVTVYVSEGKKKQAFGDYVGEDYNQVKRILMESGYAEENIISYEKPSDKPNGQIITQLQPDPDEMVVPEETRVIFEISGGPESFSLNSLKGLTEAEAKEELDDQNLKANIIEEHSEDIPEGEVIRQDPKANADIEEGDSVDLYISLGPDEKSPVSHKETFTVSYHPDSSDENEEEEEPVEQTVQIYIDDMEHDIADVYEEDTITEDTEYSVTVIIAPESQAELKVVRDGETIIQKSISYEEGE